MIEISDEESKSVTRWVLDSKTIRHNNTCRGFYHCGAYHFTGSFLLTRRWQFGKKKRASNHAISQKIKCVEMKYWDHARVFMSIKVKPYRHKRVNDLACRTCLLGWDGQGCECEVDKKAVISAEWNYALYFIFLYFYCTF